MAESLRFSALGYGWLKTRCSRVAREISSEAFDEEMLIRHRGMDEFDTTHARLARKIRDHCVAGLPACEVAELFLVHGSPRRVPKLRGEAVAQRAFDLLSMFFHLGCTHGASRGIGVG